jgi:hypothetical protein
MGRGTALKRENTEELRRRLLDDPQVRQMVAMRAYELYEQRGRVPGREAEDWLQAEREVVSFLIEEESRRLTEELIPRPKIEEIEGVQPEPGASAEPPAEIASPQEPPVAIPPQEVVSAQAVPEPPKSRTARTTSPRKRKPAAEASAKKSPSKRGAAKKSESTSRAKRTPKSEE